MEKFCKIAVGFLLLFSHFSVFSENIEGEVKDLKRRVRELEKKVQQHSETDSNVDIQSRLTEIVNILEGVNIEGGVTFIAQGAHKANSDTLSDSGESITDASYSFDLILEKDFFEDSKVLLHFEAGNGDGVTDELKLFSSVNADATGDESFDLIEVWFEHRFKSVPLTLTMGKIDVTCCIDTNEYANDETAQFLGNIFKNSPVVEFPDSNSVGIRVGFSAGEILNVNLVGVDADSNWDDVFDSMFIALQFGFKQIFFRRQGNYRFYMWLNDKNHTKWNNTSATKERGYGFGLSFDQELSEVLGVFLRYGWQNPKVYMNGEEFSLEQSYSVGLQLDGVLWNRDNDTFGFGFGQVFPSSDYKNANCLKAKSETHLEAYYNFRMNDNFALSFDFQAVWNAYGRDTNRSGKPIVLGGLRIQVDL